MKKLQLLLLVMVILPGCAYVASKTTKTVTGTNNIPVETTTMRAYTLFDSQSGLTKFRNTTGSQGSNVWGNGTYIGALNESSSSSNLVNIISAVAQGVVQGMK